MGLAWLKNYKVEELENYMDTIRVNLGERAYPVYVGSNNLGSIGGLLSNFELSRRIAVISNPVVWKYYGAKVIKSLKSSGFTPVKIIIPDGENYKNLKTVEKIYTGMLKAGIDRKGAIIALGGGVVGDIAGFVAATYMRGINYVQVPTTLLAQVDASIGGKTGVDHKLGKNLIGAFWQPLFVLADIDTLKTLPEREYRAGLAEVIKYGVIRDAGLFEFLEGKRELVLLRDLASLEYIVKRCAEIKARIVEMDEREVTGIRSILNFGHTIGHAIESATGYKKFLHGEAVAIGMVVETGISDFMTRRNFKDRIKDLINSYFKKFPEIEVRKISRYIGFDKKKSSNFIKVFIVNDIGSVEMEDRDINTFKKLITQGGRY